MKHPPGLYVLFATEMWERFSFYTMLALFTLFLKDPNQGYGWTAAKAASVYSYYLAFVYASPLIGGWIADRLTGYRRAITIGGIFFIFGHLLLAVHHVWIMYAALACLIIGNGFFKPNISTMLGNLYPEGSPLKDTAYNIFYMGINIGAFISPIVAEIMKQRYGFHPAFAVAAAGMILSMTIFWAFQKHVIRGELQRYQKPSERMVAEESEKIQDNNALIDSVPEWQRIMALCVIFLVVIVFWMGFHQNGSTLTWWANDNTDWTRSPVILRFASILTLGTVKPDVGNVSGVISNAINPFWIIVLTYPVIAFWRWLRRFNLEPSTPTKMFFGMILTSISFFIMYVAALQGGDTGRVSPWWLIMSYAVVTLGELLLSPMGLSLVSKVAPKRLRGMMMGGWFVATAVGSKLTAIGAYWDVWSHSKFFFVLGVLTLATAFVLLILLKPLKKAMPGV